MAFFSSRRQIDDNEPDTAADSTPRSVGAIQPIGFETVLGANSSLEGKFVSTANVRLDGEFEGTLEISGNVLVGETAKINAPINAKNISIAGAVRGNITGKKVQILRTGRVWGDITATALTTEEGAFIDGKISMISHEAARVHAEQQADHQQKADLAPVEEMPKAESHADGANTEADTSPFENTLVSDDETLTTTDDNRSEPE